MIRTNWKIALFISISIVVLCSSWQSNPFDINNRKETIPDTTIQIHPSIEKETISEEQIILDSLIQDPVQEETEPQTSFLEMQQQKLISENPFNVSHIPIRKKDRVQERPKIIHKPVVKKQEQNSEEIIEKPVTKEKRLPTNKFIFWLLLLQLLITTSLLSINREFINKVSRSISNDNFAKLVSRDYNAGYNPLFVLLYLIFLLSLSIFSYLTFAHYTGNSGFGIYLKVLLVVALIYFIRHFFQGFVSFVFPNQKMSSYYNFMIILFNSFLGLLLIPVNLIVAYAPDQLTVMGIYIGIGAFTLMYLLRFLRGCLHSYTFIRSYLFHFFLYLCTCEFAPVVILVKILSKSFLN